MTLSALVYNNIQHKNKHESPEEKARRIGVPLIPKLPPINPTIAVCGLCGIELKGIMMYSCNRTGCPCFTQITC